MSHRIRYKKLHVIAPKHAVPVKTAPTPLGRGLIGLMQLLLCLAVLVSFICCAMKWGH